jgi:5'-nucleotidase
MIKSYVIKDIETKRVAVVGLTVDSSKLSSPGPTITFANVIDTAQKEVQNLEAKGINKIVFLTHIGYDKDQLLAQTVAGIDIIVGGHSHTLIGDFSNVGLRSAGSYPTVIKDNERQTLVVTAWKWEAVVGDIDLFFDAQGDIIRYKAHPLMLLSDKFLRRDANGTKEEVNASVSSKIKEFINYADNLKLQKDDPTVTKIIQKYKPEIDKLMHSVIGSASADLIHVRLPGQRDSETGRVLKNGSLIAPIVAKSMFEKVEAVDSCDFAFVNAGAVRSSIPQGDITIGEVEQMLPYGNTIVTFSMSGKNLKDMFEDAIDRSLIKKEETGSFLYFWDVQISIDQTKEKGERITQFEIYKNGVWVALDENESYRVATNSYIASGGYYVQMQNDATDKYDTGFVVSNTFIEYVKKAKVLSPLYNLQ